jgi:hypothetical protein
VNVLAGRAVYEYDGTRGTRRGEGAVEQRGESKGRGMARGRTPYLPALLVAAVLMATLGWGYLALAASGEDLLVRKGIQQVVICGGSHKSGDILYKITQEVPGAESGTWGTEYGTWGTEKDGDCKVWRH